MVALNLVKEANKRRQVPDQVSELTTNRLSVYLRCLNTLDDTGVQTISPRAGAPALTLPIVVVAEMRAERLAR